MDRYICKQCGRPYNYCRACVLKPIPWRAAGFCSRECSAAFKAPKTEIPEVIEVPVIETEIEIKPKAKRKPKALIESSMPIEDIKEAIPANEDDGIHE